MPFAPFLLIFLAGVAATAQSPAMQSAPMAPAMAASAFTTDAASQVLAGDACAAGNGTMRTSRQLAEDYRQAAAWYRKAAEQKSVTGQVRLAELYRDGKGVTRDAAQAAAWYRKAAEQGDAGAQGALGLLYSLGQGVPQSDVEAYYWLDIAASAKGPRQEQYAANRQVVGTKITADELAEVQDRVEAWLAAHPHP
jgi:TPR repeat protein